MMMWVPMVSFLISPPVFELVVMNIFPSVITANFQTGGYGVFAPIDGDASCVVAKDRYTTIGSNVSTNGAEIDRQYTLEVHSFFL